MARTIATIGGTALAPGISRNRRLYTREHIAGAVAAAQERITKGDQPMVMLTHHDAGDDSTRIAASLTSVSLTEDGRVRWAAAIPDTAAGRDIASLADTSDGQPAFLEGVSIRGRWAGRVRKIIAPDGQAAETGDGLVLDGLDFTHKPGVPEARIDAFAWAEGGASETTQTVGITESVQEARVTAIDEQGPAGQDTSPGGPPGDVREVFAALMPGPPHILENGLCRTCGEIGEAGTPAVSKRDSGLSGSGRTWADPGYQSDKKQRYDLSTKDKAKAAWSYVNQKDNAAKYTPAQLKRIKGRIKAALKKFGVTVAAEGWVIEPALQVTEAIAEYYGDPDKCGSYSISASNGPTNISVSGYNLDPADLAVILQAACKGACAAMAELDPDMDGDIDVPGADSEDTDGDGADDLAARLAAALRGESEERLDALIIEATTAAAPAASTASPAPDAGPQTREELPMAEATTTEAVAQAPAAPDQATISAAVSAALAEDRAARKARKAAKRAQAAETAPAGGDGGAAVTETDEQRIARLVDERVTAKLAGTGQAPVQETEEQRVSRLVEERMVAERQRMAAAGQGPGRKGLVTEHTARTTSDGEIPADFPMDGEGRVLPMEKWSEPQRRAVGQQLEAYALGSRAST